MGTKRTLFHYTKNRQNSIENQELLAIVEHVCTRCFEMRLSQINYALIKILFITSESIGNENHEYDLVSDHALVSRSSNL